MTPTSTHRSCGSSAARSSDTSDGSWRRIAASSSRSQGLGSIPSSPVSVRTGRPEHLQRLRLPSRPVERSHQQPSWPFAERMLCDQRLELGDAVGMTAALDRGLDPSLECEHAELLEPGGGGLEPGLVDEVCESGAAPEIQCVAEQRCRLVEPASLERVRPVVRQSLEPVEIHRVGCHTERVSRAARLDRVLPECLAQPGHVALDEVRRGGGEDRPPTACRSAASRVRACLRGAGGRRGSRVASAPRVRHRDRRRSPPTARESGTRLPPRSNVPSVRAL